MQELCPQQVILVCTNQNLLLLMLTLLPPVLIPASPPNLHVFNTQYHFLLSFFKNRSSRRDLRQTRLFMGQISSCEATYLIAPGFILITVQISFGGSSVDNMKWLFCSEITMLLPLQLVSTTPLMAVHTQEPWIEWVWKICLTQICCLLVGGGAAWKPNW